MNVREIWSPKLMTASGPIVAENGSLGGFFCTTGGTLQVTKGIAAGGADIVAVFDVTEGSYYPLPFICNTGAYAVLTNAAGTFAVGS